MEVEDPGEGEVVVLSPTGYIVHEAFRQHFYRFRDSFLPPTAQQKLPCTLKENEAHLRKHEEELMRFMNRLRDEIPHVVSCHSDYFNPDLTESMRFRLTAGKLRTNYRGRGGSARIVVEIDRSAASEQLQARCFELNEWLRNQGYT